MTPQPERSGPGRRKTDEECAAHEGRMDAMERKFAWQKGAFYVASAVVGVGLTITVTVTGAVGTSIYNKLDSILTLLSANGERMSKIEGRLDGHDRWISNTEKRHEWEDQGHKK